MKVSRYVLYWDPNQCQRADCILDIHSSSYGAPLTVQVRQALLCSCIFFAVPCVCPVCLTSTRSRSCPVSVLEATVCFSLIHTSTSSQSRLNLRAGRKEGKGGRGRGRGKKGGNSERSELCKQAGMGGTILTVKLSTELILYNNWFCTVNMNFSRCMSNKLFPSRTEAFCSASHEPMERLSYVRIISSCYIILLAR